MSAVEQGSVFRTPDHFVIGLGGLRVRLEQGLTYPTSFFLQVVEAFLHLGPLGGHLRRGFRGGAGGDRGGLGDADGFERAARLEPFDR